MRRVNVFGRWNRVVATGVLAGMLAVTGCGSKADAAVATGPAAQSGSEVQQTGSSVAETVVQALKEMYVTGDVVNVRRNPEIADGNIIGTVRYGDTVAVAEVNGEWATITMNGSNYYVAVQFIADKKPAETTAPETTAPETTAQEASSQGSQTASGNETVTLNPSWKYAEFSAINSGAATLYRASGNRKNRTVCVNAGHGTSGGGNYKTLSHPDGTPKVTGGTNAEGAVKSTSISSGMEFSDGTPESRVTLKEAMILKNKLLAAGYDVLMIRESDDVQLDNIARTVMANNMADCHIALHWDSTTSDKGAFYMSVPNISSYRNMEPVASHWQEHHRLGESLISGLSSQGVKIFSGGSMEMDLTQTSYSTVPSVDIELGDKVSDHSDAKLEVLADGLLAGINQFFGN